MKIWLINPYGPIPGEEWRDYRFTLLSRELSSRGHCVIWWTAAFSHHFKSWRTRRWEDKKISENFVIRLVPTCSYKTNISIFRLIHEILFCVKVWNKSSQIEKPDIIVGIDPPQTVGILTRKISKNISVPYILDVFDLWPELFSLALPKFLKKYHKLIFWPFFKVRQKNFTEAKAVTALCKSYAELAAKEGGKINSDSQGVFFNACTFFDSLDTDENISQTTITPISKVLFTSRENGIYNIIYAGSLGPNYDLNTVLSAAKIAADQRLPLKFIVAGSGPLEDKIKATIESELNCNSIFLGRLKFEELQSVYKACDIALCPYDEESTVGMPSKVYELFTHQIPIVTSLKRDLGEIITNNNIGQQYTSGDPGSLLNSILKAIQEISKEQRLRLLEVARSFDRKKEYQKFANFIEWHSLR